MLLILHNTDTSNSSNTTDTHNTDTSNTTDTHNTDTSNTSNRCDTTYLYLGCFVSSNLSAADAMTLITLMVLLVKLSALSSTPTVLTTSEPTAPTPSVVMSKMDSSSAHWAVKIILVSYFVFCSHFQLRVADVGSFKDFRCNNYTIIACILSKINFVMKLNNAFL